MIYTRQEHWQFLEEELRAQTEAFKQKLETSATFLLTEREEVFVAQFLGFHSQETKKADTQIVNALIPIEKEEQAILEGDMILKFSTKRGMPRQGEYLYCFTVPKEMRDYRNWGKKTYGDLIKTKGNFTEAVLIWQAPNRENRDFCIAGFRGIDMEFAANISEAVGMILILGPTPPPIEYIANLQNIVQNNNSQPVSDIIDRDMQLVDWEPSYLDNKKSISDFILTQLALQNTLILIGPPGTGKTYQIADICAKLCQAGNSVLVTALTNRALIEVANKPALQSLLEEHRIFKTKLSTDEAKSMKDLRQTKDVSPQPGNLILSTFYITSGQASQTFDEPPFDYVIVDEASQALLAMFPAAKILGNKNIWIGDTKQLPPVIAINEDKINKKNCGALVDGLKTLSNTASLPVYQLTETHRLTERAAGYTGLFYNNRLESKARNVRLQYTEMSYECGKFFNSQGGPSLIKTDLDVGDMKPINALAIAVKLVKQLLSTNEKLHISILTQFVATAKALQKNVYQSIGYHKNLLIETVARVQGLTTDITIFVIPNSGYNRSLEKRLFNVATSRSKRHTIIIADKNILDNPHIDTEVKSYLQKLDEEFSFYIPSNTTKVIGCRNNEKEVIIETKKEDDAQPKTDTQNQFRVRIVGKIDISQFEKPKKEIKKDKQNIYIIDTNVFVDYPDIISKIDEIYRIILSAKVIDELDYLKISLPEEQKKNVQKALKLINENLGKRDIKMDTADLSLLPNDFNRKSPDNFILSVALKYKAENPILLTSDNGLQIKAKGLSITTITLKDFLKQYLPDNQYFKWLNNKKL
jgi:hypothetical protein